MKNKLHVCVWGGGGAENTELGGFGEIAAFLNSCKLYRKSHWQFMVFSQRCKKAAQFFDNKIKFWMVDAKVLLNFFKKPWFYSKSKATYKIASCTSAFIISNQ